MLSITLVFILFIIIAFLGVSFYFSRVVIKPKTEDYDETLKIELELERFSKKFFNSLEKEDVFIKSPHGNDLHGLWIPCKSSENTVILLHGFTYTLYGSVKYLNIFRKRGYNVLMPDNRFHGQSGGKNITFGYLEKDDVKAWIDWIVDKTDNNYYIGIHGESMGASVAMQHASIDKRASFYITDSMFSDMEDALAFSLKKDYKLPRFPLLKMAGIMSFIQGGVLFPKISPRKLISELEVPIFFIHGEEDAVIPSYMAEILYNVKKGKKKLWIATGSDHSMSLCIHPEEYEKKVYEFLTEIKAP